MLYIAAVAVVVVVAAVGAAVGVLHQLHVNKDVGYQLRAGQLVSESLDRRDRLIDVRSPRAEPCRIAVARDFTIRSRVFRRDVVGLGDNVDRECDIKHLRRFLRLGDHQWGEVPREATVDLG